MERERDIDLAEGDERGDEESADLVDDKRAGSIAAFVGGMLIGGLVGAGVALLLAPDRGDVTRRRVRRTFTDLTEGAREQFEGAREHLDELRDDARRELRRQRRRLHRRRKSHA